MLFDYATRNADYDNIDKILLLMKQMCKMDLVADIINVVLLSGDEIILKKIKDFISSNTFEKQEIKEDYFGSILTLIEYPQFENLPPEDVINNILKPIYSENSINRVLSTLTESYSDNDVDIYYGMMDGDDSSSFGDDDENDDDTYKSSIYVEKFKPVDVKYDKFIFEKLFELDNYGFTSLCEAIVDEDFDFIRTFYPVNDDIKLLKQIYQYMNNPNYLKLYNITESAAQVTATAAMFGIRLLGEDPDCELIFRDLFKEDEWGFTPLCEAIYDEDYDFIRNFYFIEDEYELLKQIFEDMNNKQFLIDNDIDENAAQLIASSAFSQLRSNGYNIFELLRNTKLLNE